MLQWVRQEASDGLAIKAFTVLSALAEAGELVEEQGGGGRGADHAATEPGGQHLA